MEKIEELFKKIVYTGVGLVSLTADRVEKFVEEMVKEDKISEKEGKKLVDEFFKSTEEKSKELENQLKKAVEKAVEKFKFASTAKLEELNNRVKVLEELLKNKKN